MEEYLKFNRRLLSDTEATALISKLLVPPAAVVGVERQVETFVLLSRWARQISQRQQHSPGAISMNTSQQQTLIAAANVAIHTLQATSVSQLSGAAAVVFLGSAAGALVSDSSRTLIEQVAETVGTSLLSFQSMQLEQRDQPQAAAAQVIEFLISGTAALLPALTYNADAVCWIFTALLSYLGTITIHESSRLAKSLAGLYPAMRTATTAIAVSTLHHQQQICLNSFYGALRAVLLPSNRCSKLLSAIGTEGDEVNRQTGDLRAAAATLAAGGMLESLARYHQQRPSPPIIPLIEALAELLQHSAAAAAATTVHKNSLNIQQIATGVAVAQTYQACRMPRPTPATLQCCVGTLLDTVLDIDPLLDVLKYSSDTASVGQLSAALAHQAQQHGWNNYALPLQSTAVTQLSQVRLSPEQLENVLDIMKRAAKKTHEQYRQYILQFWTQTRAQVDYHPLQALLEKNFIASMELLMAATMNCNLSSSSRIGKKALSSSTVLCIIANLQFCRVNNSLHYSRLLKGALQSLPQDLFVSSFSTGASTAHIDVVQCLPAYGDLEALIPAHGNAPAWLVDALSASKVQLLCTALTPCCRSLSEESGLDILAPLAFLYLLHPHIATSTSAHTLLWSLMGVGAQHAEQLAPYYVTRCLEKLPLSSLSTSTSSATTTVGTVASELLQHLQHFSQGLSTALATIPPGSPLGLLCVERILNKCSEMVVAGVCWDNLCLAVFNVATQQLLTVDYTLVDAVAQQLQGFIMNSPARLRGRLSEGVLAMVAGTEDCVRKPRLATWYQDLSAATAANVPSFVFNDPNF
ncbi:hypothetical protein Ndes2526B_g01751 [Nannochloris sp. 'desiccata']|nr:hypothetical protein NADE_002516 [Chlorella desiccata (nom. nud.)]